MKTKLLLFLIFIASLSWGQNVYEDFNNVPILTNTSSYLTRSWINSASNITWTSTDSRTDQSLTGKALCFRGGGVLESSSYANGMGNLSFNFVRGFTNSDARSFKVYVNNVQLGNTITVSPSSNNIAIFSYVVNVAGPVVLRIEFVGGQINIDDISWNDYPPCTPPSFSGTLTSVNNCGNSVISYNNVDALPTNELFWQTSASGTSTATPFTGDRSVTTSGTYFLRRYSGNCWSNAILLTVTVNAIPTITGSFSANDLCTDNTSTLTYSGTNLNEVFIQTSNVGVDESLPFSVVSNRNVTPGTYYIRRKIGNCWSAAAVGPVTISFKPVLSGILDIDNICGSGVLQYNGSEDLSNIYIQTSATATSTSKSFNIISNRSVTAGTYYLRYYDGACWSTATNAVTVYSLPTLGGNLSVTNTSCVSSTISYSSASETGLYWQTSASGTDTANAYSPITVNTAGTYFIRRLVNGCWSAAKQITVSAFTQNSIATQPVDVTVTVDGTASFTVSSFYPSGVSYQWQVSNGSAWTNISGATSSTYNFTNAQLSDSGNEFRVLVTDQCTTLTSNVATLNVVVGPCLSLGISKLILIKNSNNEILDDNNNIWTTTSSGVVVGNVACGTGDGIIFNGRGDELVSPPLINPNRILFDARRSNNSDSWLLEVQISSSPNFSSNVHTLFSISRADIGTSCTSIPFEILINPNHVFNGFNYIRFIDLRSSGSAERSIDNIQVYCGDSCPSVNLTSVFPVSGPIGTIVTITSNDDLSNQNIYFGNIAAQIVNRNAGQIQFIVPSGINTSTFSVYENATCATNQNFEITNEIGVDCYGQNFNSIFISEVYDADSGSLGYVELYNPTNVAVNLSTFKLRRYGEYTDLTSYNEADFSGIIAPNSSLVFKLNNSGNVANCNVSPIQLNLSGINANDLLELYNGNTLLDSVITPNETGYSLTRNSLANAPNAVYNANDWLINLTETCAGLGNHNYTVLSQPVSHNIALNYTCGVNQATIDANASVNLPATITGYQWFVNVPNTTNWVALANGSDYAGVTTSSLQILSTAGKTNYQYYCAISSSDITCNSISNAIVLKDNEATIWDGVVWSNSVPTDTKVAVINGNYDTLINGSFTSCSLVINSGFNLTIQPNSYIEVINNITNNGTLKVEDKGQLVQVNDLGVNIGNIVLDRKVMLKRLEYSQYATPVQTANVFALSPNTVRNRIWEWVPTINGSYGNWIIPAGDMVIGRGYGISAPNNFSSTTSSEFLTTFTGVPNNGVINYQVSRGNYTGADYINTLNNVNVTKWDDNYNLIGNPYPSSISATDFILANQSVIEGSIEIWVPSPLSATNSDPFYGNFDLNYSSSSFIVYNLTGQIAPGSINFNGYIGSAQAFFVKMLDGPQANANVMFNNAMRSKSNNNVFYRNSRANEPKMWLNLSSENQNSFNLINQILIGYVNGATNLTDNLYDAVSVKSLKNEFYSLHNNSVEAFSIQGKQFPFENSDIVPLGINIAANGSYQISIDKLVGEFENNEQQIYLEDRLVGYLHNLKNGPYFFTATKGRYEDRFVIKYQDARLSLNDLQLINDVIVFGSETLAIQSSIQNIKQVQIFDTLGRLILMQNVNDRQVEFNSLQKNNTSLILNIELENGVKISKKYIY